MKKICMFCGKEATGRTEVDNWKFDTCSDWNCKRKKHILFKILIGDLSDDTILQMARCIPDNELYWKPQISDADVRKEPLPSSMRKRR